MKRLLSITLLLLLFTACANMPEYQRANRASSGIMLFGITLSSIGAISIATSSGDSPRATNVSIAGGTIVGLGLVAFLINQLAQPTIELTEEEREEMRERQERRQERRQEEHRELCPRGFRYWCTGE